MPPEAYLPRLTARLADGVARLPEAVRLRHRDYLLERQNPDGGFSGREGGSDLYYTGFSLRGLAVLDALTPEVCAATAGFLRGSLDRKTSVVDFFSLLYSLLLVQLGGGPDLLAGAPPDWPDRVAATLAGFRTPDGGYTKSAGGTTGSTYHSFLVGLCYELLGREVPAAEQLAGFVLSRRREDGGFVEIGPMRRSGTNPTAAAVGLLSLLPAPVPGWTDEVRRGVVSFLTQMPSAEGGIRANTRIPLADLLSTFTASWTLAELGALEQLDGAKIQAYARGVERPTGGFRGGLWDDGHDVEYTFYGLGVLGLFA
jgi:geranylgeranyl transferase type-2 subunit beta